MRAPYPQNEWVDALWAHIESLAADLDGKQVVTALQTASMAAWDAGLDHAFDRIRSDAREFGPDAVGFDTSWMTLFAVELAKTRVSFDAAQEKDQTLFRTRSGRADTQKASER